MVVDFAIAQEPEQPVNLLVADCAPEADAIDVVHRHQHGGLVRDHAQVIETAGRSENSFRFDALHNAETVIRVNDLVTNLECHTSPKRRGDVGKEYRAVSSLLSIPKGCTMINENAPKIRGFCTFLPRRTDTRGEHGTPAPPGRIAV